MRKVRLLATLTPSMPHFNRFATDERLSGIRINSAMMELDELDNEFSAVERIYAKKHVPLFYDIKGRQLRIREVFPKTDHIELKLNHNISVSDDVPVLFKGGEDMAVLSHIATNCDNEQTLVFHPGAPHFNVKSGESICIRDDSFVVNGDTFPQYEIEKIQRVKASGLFTKYVLSYVESQNDLNQFRSLVGNDVDVIAKIESRPGLNWVESGWKPQPRTRLMAARGDLYLEVKKPHEILNAMKLIIKKDPNAIVGSRILLSCVNRDIPDAVDFSELAWLYDIGYNTMMLCDDLCIREERLSRAVNVFDAFRNSYCQNGEKSDHSQWPDLFQWFRRKSN